MQGLILLNKPQNRTSFSAVAAIKRLTGEKRVGHTGTLDPMATGVLPVLLGRATALSDLMLDAEKKYTAVIRLGLTTDTEDITGTVLSESPVNITAERLAAVLEQFTGTLRQRPPMYSALKKDGVRLYQLAREGKTVEIPEREITVFSLKVTVPLNEANEFTVEVHVSKGTYIRSLARDIGEALGCGATLAALCRTEAAGFRLDECVSLDSLSPDTVGAYMVNEEMAVRHLRSVSVTPKQAIRFCNGGPLDWERLRFSPGADGELLRVYAGKQLLGIGISDFAKQCIGIKCILKNPKEIST